MENAKNSFVVTVTPIPDNLDSNKEISLQTPDKQNSKIQQVNIKISSHSKEKLEALIKLSNPSIY